MVYLFGKLLKILPFVGAALILTAIGRSLQSGGMDQWSLALTTLGFLLFLAMFLKIEAASLRYYLNLTIVATLMLANLTVAYLILDNHWWRKDLTRNSRFSLAEPTRQFLRSLQRKVELEAIATSNEPFSSYLKLYSAESDMVSFRITNPYTNVSVFDTPDEKMQINDLWIRSKQDGAERKHRIQFEGTGDLHRLENEIVSGILNVVKERPTRLYFLTGHGEKSPNPIEGAEGQEKSFSKFAAQLTQRAIEVRGGLNLQSHGFVPEDCDLLGIVGPVADYSLDEIRSLAKYLARGGRLLVLLDPVLNDSQRTPLLRDFLALYGVRATEDIVVDDESHSAEHNAFVPLVREFSPSHPITKDMQSSIAPLPLRGACAIEKLDSAPEDLDIEPLLTTSKRSWTIDQAQYRQVARTKKIPAGPTRQICVGMALAPKVAEDASKRPRIVFFGNSSFLTNAQLANTQLYLGYMAVTWLSGQKDAVAIRKTESDQTPIVLERRQRTLLSMFSVIAMPFLLFFGGLAYTTIRRRKR